MWVVIQDRTGANQLKPDFTDTDGITWNKNLGRMSRDQSGFTTG